MGLDRQIVGHFVTVLALSVGAWMMFVEPMVREITDERGFLADVRRSGLAGIDDSSLQRITHYIDGVRTTVGWVHTRSRFAEDTSGIYSSIMLLAEAEGVRVDRLTPGTETVSEDAVLSSKSLDVVVRGPYLQVATFLGTLDRLEGFVRIRRVTLATVAAQDGVEIEAAATCDVLAVNLPPALAAMIPEDGP